MIAKQIIGGGLTGAFNYLLGQGRERATGQRRPPAANENESRVAWISGQGFGWTPSNRDTADLARRVMEYDALNQHSKTRQCKKDCLHLVLSWAKEEKPEREEMERAAQEALRVLGMEKAKAIFVCHRDTEHAHIHIIASRINPENKRAFENFHAYEKLQDWALDWEREHGQILCKNREKKDQLTEAIESRNAADVLDLMLQRRATMTARELERTLRRDMTAKQTAEFTQQIFALPEFVQLYDRETGQHIDRFTSDFVRKAEQAALADAERLYGNKSHGLAARHLAAALERYPTMTDEQRRAFDHATGAEGLALIIGKAGTGKTYTMQAIRDAYEAGGYRVIGLSHPNKVAQSLEASGFKDARTIQRALMQIKNNLDMWDGKTVLMVDEAAMVGTRILAELKASAVEARAKIILVGDDRQLASIERGGLFTELRQRYEAAEITQVKRQKNADHKAAAEMLARGEFAEAIDAFEKLNCIHRQADLDAARAALVEKWKQDSAAAPEKSRFIFAYTNDEVLKLNAAVRAIRKERGELGEDYELETKDGKLCFAANDRIVFNTTDKRKGIINGASGTIEQIEGTQITLRLEGDKRLTFDAAEVQAFRHAYAGTIYKGQGDTLDQAYLFHTPHWKDAASYVALTRHRESVDLFVSDEATRDNADLARQMARHEETRASLAFATEAEAREITRQREQESKDRLLVALEAAKVEAAAREEQRRAAQEWAEERQKQARIERTEQAAAAHRAEQERAAEKQQRQEARPQPQERPAEAKAPPAPTAPKAEKLAQPQPARQEVAPERKAEQAAPQLADWQRRIAERAEAERRAEIEEERREQEQRKQYEAAARQVTDPARAVDHHPPPDKQPKPQTPPAPVAEQRRPEPVATPPAARSIHGQAQQHQPEQAAEQRRAAALASWQSQAGQTREQEPPQPVFTPPPRRSPAPAPQERPAEAEAPPAPTPAPQAPQPTAAPPARQEKSAPVLSPAEQRRAAALASWQSQAGQTREQEPPQPVFTPPPRRVEQAADPRDHQPARYDHTAPKPQERPAEPKAPPAPTTPAPQAPQPAPGPWGSGPAAKPAPQAVGWWTQQEPTKAPQPTPGPWGSLPAPHQPEQMQKPSNTAATTAATAGKAAGAALRGLETVGDVFFDLLEGGKPISPEQRREIVRSQDTAEAAERKRRALEYFEDQQRRASIEDEMSRNQGRGRER